MYVPKWFLKCTSPNGSFIPDDTPNKNVIWTSSDESVAAVSNGVVTAISPGRAIVSVKSEISGRTANCSVTVTQPVTGISLNKNSTTLFVGSTKTLTAAVSPDNASNKNVTWSSSNEAVATVSNDGVITAIAPGKAVITAKTQDGGKTDKCSVTVREGAISITDYSKGDNIDFKVSLSEEKGYLVAVIFNSNGKMTDVEFKPAQNGTKFSLTSANGKKLKVLWINSVLSPFDSFIERLI